jgi:DNA-binding transcriptional ArsR family regulator
MTLRIRFTASDVGQVRIAERPDVLWEILLAAQMLQTQDGTVVFGSWRRRAQRRLGAPLREVLALAAPQGYSPDLLTPTEAEQGLEAGLEAVRQVPRARLLSELGALSPARRASPAVSGLAEGTARALTRLTEGMGAFHGSLLAPFWPQIERQLAADRAKRASAVLRGGVDHLLATLHPTVRWRPPVLDLTSGPFARDLHLDGRGLRLVPGFFCWQHPIVLRDPGLPPVLVYPIEHDPRWSSPPGPKPGSRSEVAALMGRTRAAVLEESAVGRSTTELAKLLRISPASASEHLKTLREAGLVTSRRYATATVHLLSPLGRALLEGTPERPY